MKQKNKFIVEPHDGIDKSFELYNTYFSAKVNYDDVDHDEVDVATDYIVEILNANWQQSVFEARYKIQMEKVFNGDDKYGHGSDLREEYGTFDEYWKSRWL